MYYSTAVLRQGNGVCQTQPNRSVITASMVQGAQRSAGGASLGFGVMVSYVCACVRAKASRTLLFGLPQADEMRCCCTERAGLIY